MRPLLRVIALPGERPIQPRNSRRVKHGPIKFDSVAIEALGKRWVQLHRLVYAAAVAGCLHFLWQVKKDVREPLIYAAVLAALFAARGALWLRASRARPR
jgi:hypothetical protein